MKSGPGSLAQSRSLKQKHYVGKIASSDQFSYLPENVKRIPLCIIKCFSSSRGPGADKKQTIILQEVETALAKWTKHLS